STIVWLAPAPRMVKVLPDGSTTCSAYVPVATRMVSPDAAASTAPWMVAKQPPVPPGLTQRVAARAGAAHAARARVSETDRQMSRTSFMSGTPFRPAGEGALRDDLTRRADVTPRRESQSTRPHVVPGESDQRGWAYAG